MTGAALNPDRSARLLGWLWQNYLGHHRAGLAVAIILMVFEGALLGALSYMIKPMFDEVFIAGDRGAIAWVGLAVAGIFALRALSAFGHRVLMVGIGQRVAARLQGGMLAHMLTLDSRYFQENSPGTLIERVRGDTQAVSTLWEAVLSAMARDVVALVALLGVALSIDWLWTLIAVAGAPLLMLPIGALQRRVRRATRSSRDIAAHIATRLDEIFHGINTIKLNHTEAHEGRRVTREVTEFAGAHLRAAAAQAGIVAMIDIIAAVGFFGVLTYGGLQIIAGEKTVGEFMSFFTAMALIFDPMRRIGNVSGAWSAASASLARLRAVFEELPTILSPARPLALAQAPGQSDIVFENVNFAYGDKPVLRGASFTAAAGKTTAIVGASGAGKSTVFNLLARIVDPQSGRISIGGTAIDALALDELRGLFSVVSQEALLFDETLRDNVVMGQDAIDEENLSHALSAAHVADFLGRMPAGLDSPAGPRGSNLSGGQRQRIAIARAILRDAPVLLLDEATSALDAQSERLVQKALEGLAKGRTTLVIAHRLATIRDADHIIVMDHGQVVDQGTHEDLLARGGKYADLYRLQF